MQFEFILASLGTIFILMIIIGLIINALFLGIALGFVNGENRELGTTFVTALGMGLLGWIPVLGCIISWYLIKTRHEVGWGGAIVAWLLTFIIEAIVLALLIFGGILALLALPF